MNQLVNRPSRSLTQAGGEGIGFARHPMVSRENNAFTLVDGAGNKQPIALVDHQGRRYIDVVIVDASPHPNRMYFGGKYGDGQPPQCFSNNGVGPSTQSMAPQAPTCAVCPQAVWGSAVGQDGKGIPACQTGKNLAVVVVGDQRGMVYEFRVPPGSFNIKPTTDPQEGGWAWYLKMISTNKVELCDVVTRISFLPGKLQGHLGFKPLSHIGQSPELVALANQWINSDEAAERVGLDDKPIDPSRFGAGDPRAAVMAPPPPVSPPQAFMAPLPPPEPGPASGQPITGSIITPKRGRPPKKAETDPNLDIPPFLQRPPQEASAPAPQPAPPFFGAAKTEGFGLANPQIPPDDLQVRLNEAFKLPT